MTQSLGTEVGRTGQDMGRCRERYERAIQARNATGEEPCGLLGGQPHAAGCTRKLDNLAREPTYAPLLHKPAPKSGGIRCSTQTRS